MTFNKIETKWNADDEKLEIVIELEKNLEDAFLSFDFDAIYTLLRAYRRQTLPKFVLTEQKNINTKMDSLTESLQKYQTQKTEKLKKEFYINAEDLFLQISQLLKEAGVYYREGKNASHAILER